MNFEGKNSKLVNFYNGFNIHQSNDNVVWRPSSDAYLGSEYGPGTVRVVLLDPRNGTIGMKADKHGFFDVNNFASWRKWVTSGDDFPIGAFGVGTIHKL